MLTTGHFLLESVTMPGGFCDHPRGHTEQQGNKLPMVPLEIGGGGEELTGREAQEKVANPDPLPELQVRPDFKLHLAMDMSEEMTGPSQTLAARFFKLPPKKCVQLQLRRPARERVLVI